MKVLKVLFFALLLKTGSGWAQNSSPISAGVDVGTGAGSISWAPSILYHEEIGSRKLPWLRVGLGFRAWGYYAGRTNLESAAIRNTTEILEYRDVSVNGLSVVTGLNIVFWKIDLGVDTDLLGLAFGSERNAFYEKNTHIPGSGEANYNKWLPTHPTIFNALPLVLNKNSGQSEAFVRFRFSPKVGIKLGYLYGRTTYTTRKAKDFNVYLDNQQRHVSVVYGLPYAALSFSISE
jgi:hypothetical protein